MNEVAATARQEGAMRHVFFAGKSSRAVNQVFKKRSVAGDVVSSFCFDPPFAIGQYFTVDPARLEGVNDVRGRPRRPWSQTNVRKSRIAYRSETRHAISGRSVRGRRAGRNETA